MLFGIYQCMHKKKSAEAYTDVVGISGQTEVQSDQFLSVLTTVNCIYSGVAGVPIGTEDITTFNLYN